MSPRTEEPNLELVLSLARQLRPIDQARLIASLCHQIEVALLKAEPESVSQDRKVGLLGSFWAEINKPVSVPSDDSSIKRGYGGTRILAAPYEDVKAVDVRFDGSLLQVDLSDGRMVSLRVDKVSWLRWLAKATPTKRRKWHLEPGGYAIYWDDLDDGIEIRHLLTLQSLV